MNSTTNTSKRDTKKNNVIQESLIPKQPNYRDKKVMVFSQKKGVGWFSILHWNLDGTTQSLVHTGIYSKTKLTPYQHSKRIKEVWMEYWSYDD